VLHIYYVDRYIDRYLAIRLIINKWFKYIEFHGRDSRLLGIFAFNSWELGKVLKRKEIRLPWWQHGLGKPVSVKQSINMVKLANWKAFSQQNLWESGKDSNRLSHCSRYCSHPLQLDFAENCFSRDNWGTVPIFPSSLNWKVNCLAWVPVNISGSDFLLLHAAEAYIKKLRKNPATPSPYPKLMLHREDPCKAAGKVRPPHSHSSCTVLFVEELLEWVQ
jgi:hypothetical protein